MESEFREVVDGNAVEPDSWLARDALDTLMVFNLATPSADAWKIGAVFVRRRGAIIARSPFARATTAKLVAAEEAMSSCRQFRRAPQSRLFINQTTATTVSCARC